MNYDKPFQSELMRNGANSRLENYLHVLKGVALGSVDRVPADGSFLSLVKCVKLRHLFGAELKIIQLSIR